MKHLLGENTEVSQPATKTSGWFGLGKALTRIFSRGNTLTEEMREELEELLLQSDVGVVMTTEILEELDKRLSNSEELPHALLETIVAECLSGCKAELLPTIPDGKLHIMLVVGSNGSGKTTSLAKLAHYYASYGYKAIFAAGDTFRAAAIEQLQHWGERLGIRTIAHKQGGDSAAVIFDAISAASARGCDLVLVDTAGRLHNKQQLLEELKKIHRIAAKAAKHAQLHTVLVLDAGTGVGAVPLVRTFSQSVPLDGLIVTKLDGSAKGGSVLTLAREVSIAFLGLGERVDDLQLFNAANYAKQLLD